MLGNNHNRGWGQRCSRSGRPAVRATVAQRPVLALAAMLVLVVALMSTAFLTGCKSSGSSVESTTSTVSSERPGWTGERPGGTSGRPSGTGSTTTETTTGSSEATTTTPGTSGPASSGSAPTTPETSAPVSEAGGAEGGTTPPTLVAADYANGVSDGIYLVGTDISSGLYKGIVTGSAAHWEISWDANGERFVAGGDPVGQFYVKVTSGQYLRLRGVTIIKASSSPAATLLTGDISDGTYRVGYDIAAGWYQGTVDSSLGYWEIASDANGQSLVACDYVKGPFSLKVKSGQFLTLRGVTLSQ